MGLAAAALILGAAGSAHGFEAPWVGPGENVLSPDGRYVYATGNRTLTFRLDGAGGLKELSDIEPGGETAALSPDGRSLYVGDTATLHVFDRDPASGLLTHVRTIDTGSASSADCCNTVLGLAVSPDGRFLYATFAKDRTLVTYTRDPQTSDLVLRDVRPSVAGGTLVLSNDGRHLYTGGEGVAVFECDATGIPTARQHVWTEGSIVGGVALSADERSLVTVGTDLSLFGRDPESGALGRPSTFSVFGEGTGYGSPGVRDSVAAGRDGSLYMLNARRDAIVHARLDGDRIEVVRSYSREGDGLAHLVEPKSLSLSPDGRVLLVSVGGVPGAIYPRVGAVLHFTVDPSSGALSLSESAVPLVGKPGPRALNKPHGSLSGAVVLEDRARFTNELTVDLLVDPPDGVASLRFSDDRGRLTPLLRVVPDGRYRFTLAPHAADGRREVTAIFTYAGRPLTTPAVSASIVVDRKRPAVIAARREGRVLRLRARDDRAGVESLQLASRRTDPRPVQRFRSRVRLAGDPRWVRVQDHAGNRSSWRRIL